LVGKEHVKIKRSKLSANDYYRPISKLSKNKKSRNYQQIFLDKY